MWIIIDPGIALVSSDMIDVTVGSGSAVEQCDVQKLPNCLKRFNIDAIVC